jgi:hypothetical protein
MTRTARAGAGGVSLGAIVGSVLLPKCPLCVAAWLSVAGIGATAAPFVRPALVVVAMAAALVTLLTWRAEGRRRRCCPK